MSETKSCAFTGHRPEKLPFGYDENHPNSKKIKLLLSYQIQQLYQLGVTHFLTGCCLGVDTWAAEEIIDLKKYYPHLELTCVIPFPEQPNKWSTDEKNRYNNILEKSDHLQWIDYMYRKGVYYKRNKSMVDQSDFLIAVCDVGQKIKSGSHYTIEYAIKKNRSIFCIDPKELEISRILLNLTDWEDLISHS